MKKIFTLFFVFIFFSLNSATSEKKIIKNILIENDFALVLLKDDSIWKVYTAKLLEQSWSDWWRDVFPKQPGSEFLCNFDLWEVASEVEISFFDKKNVDLEIFHLAQISECDYIMKNLKAENLGFAKRLTLEEFFEELFSWQKCQCFGGQLKSEYYKGYRDGYVFGYYEKHHSEDCSQ